jgi:hypothetical protein
MHVLAVLPEGKLFDLVYSEAIAPALSEVNASVIRASPDLKNEVGQVALREAITRADLVIVDLTGTSPGAMYAAGLAGSADRKTLFVTQHLEDFPLDAKAFEVIPYAGDRQFLKSELIAWFSGAKRAAGAQSADSARERFVATFGDILRKHGYAHRGDLYLENATTFVLVNQDMELALVQELARRAREQGLRLKLM